MYVNTYVSKQCLTIHTKGTVANVAESELCYGLCRVFISHSLSA